VTIDETCVHVTLDKRAHNPFLVASGLANQPVPMPWFGNKQLALALTDWDRGLVTDRDPLGGG